MGDNRENSNKENCNTDNRYKDTAILLVSFGTAYREAQIKTIDRIEQAIRSEWIGYEVRSAWTSELLRRKVREREGIAPDNVDEALKRLAADGYRRVMVQPTYIINGIEYGRMCTEVLRFKDQFDKIRFGDPLLSSAQDQLDTIHAVLEEFLHLEKNEILVLMGHGTSHPSDVVYSEMNEMFRRNGCGNVFVGTLRGTPSFADVDKFVSDNKGKTIHLAPLMLVAGTHVCKHMAGEQKDSWKQLLQREGYQTVCHLRGLGEYPKIREIYLRHLRKIIC